MHRYSRPTRGGSEMRGVFSNARLPGRAHLHVNIVSYVLLGHDVDVPTSKELDLQRISAGPSLSSRRNV